MKKKITLLGLVLVLIFGMAGCGSKAELKEGYEQAVLEQYANAIIQAFSSMGEADVQKFKDMTQLELELTLLQSGIPIQAESFIGMLEAWGAAVEENGSFITHGDYELKVSNTGAVLTTQATFKDRSASMAFAFDRQMYMQSLAVNADYTIGEILRKAGLNTLLGMGTVFSVLIFISFMISLFKYIPLLEKKLTARKNQAEKNAVKSTAAPAKSVVTETAEPGLDDPELIAVIAAAVAAAEGASTDSFVVRSIRRRKSNKWS